MSSCNICGYKADYIKEESNNIEDMLCGACLNEYEEEDEMIDNKRLITAYSLRIMWSDGVTEIIDLPDDFRQAHKDIGHFLDGLEEERNNE